MAQRIVIDPVTRIEGHSRITINLDKHGEVREARFHVTQFRGFEKFVDGRPYTEMPSLMARTCGICPVSHLLASSKACDQLLAVKIPPTAEKLRRLNNLAQFLQSHSLSFFHLSSPDLLLGLDADPAVRNIVGVLQRYPDLARDGVRLRGIGQKIIEFLGGKRVHPAWVVPGGVNAPLTPEVATSIQALLPEARAIMTRTHSWFRDLLPKWKEEVDAFGSFPSMFLSLTTGDSEFEIYDGPIKITDSSGKVIADKLDATRYFEYLAEQPEPDTFLKSPYYIPLGYPNGMYRVGPLARLNNAKSMGTPLADAELKLFKALQNGPVLSSFHFHYARLIEMLYCVERAEQMLADPTIVDSHVRAIASPNAFEGVGVSEAPRGTLIHHYRINEQGLMTWANLIIATGHNSLAMNKSVTQVAQKYVRGEKLAEGALNRVEAVIRCYDPCLSCSTHAIGQMPLRLELYNAEGRLTDVMQRES